jgi:hypothetical protein
MFFSAMQLLVCNQGHGPNVQHHVHLQVQITQDPSDDDEVMAKISQNNGRAQAHPAEQDSSTGKAKSNASPPSSPGGAPQQQVMMGHDH